MLRARYRLLLKIVNPLIAPFFSAPHLLRGNIGERKVVAHLNKQGYRIMATNWRCRYGEVDIIAEHRNELVFVEVKTRTGHWQPLITAEDAVHPKKQERIKRCAEVFVAERDQSPQGIRHKNVEIRFDIVTVLLELSPRQLPRWQLTHFEAAFF